MISAKASGFGNPRRSSLGSRHRRSLRRAAAFSIETLEPRVLLSENILVANTGNYTIGEYTTSGATVKAPLVSGLSYPWGIAVSGSNLFITNNTSNTIGEYTPSGATVNASLVSGLVGPDGIAVSESDLFVTNSDSGTIGEYTTSGATVNASLVSGLSGPSGIAMSGSDLFIANYFAGTIGEYTTSGATVNASLVSGLSNPSGIAVSDDGADLFVTNSGSGTIGEYTTSGATVNASLVSGLTGTPLDLAVSGSDLFVTRISAGTIGEYTTSGATVNASLVSGLPGPIGIAVVASVPQLAFQQQPSNVTADNQMSSVTVTTIGPTDTITLSIASGPGGAVLNGPLTVQAQGGVATFTGLSLNAAGTYTLQASDGFLTDPPAISSSFTVSASASTLSAPAVSATFGGTALLSATLTSSGMPVPNQPVSFSVDNTVAGSAVTDQNGVATLPYALGNLAVGDHAVVATFAGDPGHSASSANSTLTVTDQNIQGLVWVDLNNDGNVDFGEGGISGVAITLTNSAGQIVGQTTTDTNGLYNFNHVPPDTYTIAQGADAAGYTEGKDSLGTITDLSGNPIAGGVGNSSVQDEFSQVVIGLDQNAINYNFGEQPAPGSAVSKGQAAGIGFWQNKNGQALILTFTSIGNWLAATLPQTFGGLAGASPQQVATLYQQQFVLKDKLDAQFMATALNVFATDGSLGGLTAAYYGFTVGQYGLGDSTWNIGADGTAFNVSNNTTLTVMQILQDWDQQTNKSSTSLRKLALDVFGGINGKGGL